MKAFLKTLYFLLVPKPRLPKDRAIILMYHSISEDGLFATVSPPLFVQQMQYLADNQYQVISLAELVRRLKAGEPLGGAVAITFDDGYVDNLTTAAPVLKQHQFPATIFIETNRIGTRTPEHEYLSAEQLRQLPELVTTGAHTKSHPKLAKLSVADALDEIAGSKRRLEELLGTPCTLFAYPFGSYSEQTLMCAAEAGVVGAVTVREGTVGPDTSPLELPRVSIDRDTSWPQFVGKLSLAVDRYKRLKSN